MTATPIHLSLSSTGSIADELARLLDDIVAVLFPDAIVRLDLCGCNCPDIRIVQLVDAARRHAADIGADLMLSRPPGFDVERLLARAGLDNPANKAFWFQGITCQ